MMKMMTRAAGALLSRRAARFGSGMPSDRSAATWPAMLCPLVLAFLTVMVMALNPARAAMSPETYTAPDRIGAGFQSFFTSFRSGSYVAPWAGLAPGQYVNPSTGMVEGAPLCGRWGHPLCGLGLK